MGNMKEINIKNRTYQFFDDMINIKDFDLNQIKIDRNITMTLIFITLGMLL